MRDHNIYFSCEIRNTLELALKPILSGITCVQVVVVIEDNFEIFFKCSRPLNRCQ